MTFDNSSNIADTTLGITVNSLNIAIDSAVGFQYIASFDTLFIGGIINGANGAGFGTNDFILEIVDASTTAPLVGDFFYVDGGSTFFNPSQISLTLGTPTAVPEPTSLLLLAGGLVGISLLRRRLSVGA